MWSQAPYSEAPYSGGVLPATPPDQVLPPPIPGGTTTFSQVQQQGAYPWSFGSWAGGTQPVSSPAGGVVAVPDPANGVMQVLAWWPNATRYELVRITPDGTITPVRGAYPLNPAVKTRTNCCLNPSATAGLNGYLPGAGSPTLSQISRTDITGTGWRATIASAGTCEVVVPVSIPAGQPVTVSADLRFSSRPSSVIISAQWVDGTGAGVGTWQVALTGDAINASVDQWARQAGWQQPPPTAVQCSTVRITASGLPTGSTMDGSRIVVEQGYTDGTAVSYTQGPVYPLWRRAGFAAPGNFTDATPFDGDTLGGTWLGTAGLSASLLAPVVEVVDGECPLDVPVVYMVANPALVGGSARSTPAVLDSVGDIGWVTHPASPDSPLACHPTQAPSPVHVLPQLILPVIGRRFPVPVSAAVRLAPKGSYTLWTDTFAERDQLLHLLEDGQPLLLRAPASFGYGYSQWLSFGDMTEDPQGRPAYMAGRALAGNYQEVDAPASVGLLGA